MTESRYLDPEDVAFNDIERQAKQRKEAVKVAVSMKDELIKIIAESYDRGVKDALEVARDATIEEVAQHVEKIDGEAAQILIAVIAAHIREMKK